MAFEESSASACGQDLQLRAATRVRDRLRGLLYRPRLDTHQGLCIRPCAAVHTFGMSYAIDVIFLDAEHVILKRVDVLMPWRMSICLGAAIAVELPAGYCAAYADYPERLRAALAVLNAQ